MAPPPPTAPRLVIVHLMEYCVPLRRADVGTVVLVQASPRTAIVLTNLKGLPNLEIICEAFLVFVRHIFNYFRFPIDRRVAVLFVLGYTRVRPIAFLGGVTVFFTALRDRADGLAYVGRGQVAWALELVDAGFLGLVMVGPVWSAQYVFKLGAGPGD